MNNNEGQNVFDEVMDQLRKAGKLDFLSCMEMASDNEEAFDYNDAVAQGAHPLDIAARAVLLMSTFAINENFRRVDWISFLKQVHLRTLELARVGDYATLGLLLSLLEDFVDPSIRREWPLSKTDPT